MPSTRTLVALTMSVYGKSMAWLASLMTSPPPSCVFCRHDNAAAMHPASAQIFPHHQNWPSCSGGSAPCDPTANLNCAKKVPPPAVCARMRSCVFAVQTAALLPSTHLPPSLFTPDLCLRPQQLAPLVHVQQMRLLRQALRPRSACN